LNGLYFSIMNQLSLLTRCTHDAYDRIVSKSAYAANASQTTAFALRL
jgi:hypothetical protein